MEEWDSRMPRRESHSTFSQPPERRLSLMAPTSYASTDTTWYTTKAAVHASAVM